MSPEDLSVPVIIKSHYGISKQILIKCFLRNFLMATRPLFGGGGDAMIISALSKNYLCHESSYKLASIGN